ATRMRDRAAPQLARPHTRGGATAPRLRRGPRPRARRGDRAPPQRMGGREIMSVRLTPDEAWGVLERAHTGILTTLRRDGVPISLPMWFAVLDRTICFSTPARAKKLSRIRHDPRGSFLVESGERWAELEAVHLTGRIERVTDEDEIARIADAV